jgi:hypothetical protein
VSSLSLRTLTLLLSFSLLPDIDGDSSSSLSIPPPTGDKRSLLVFNNKAIINEIKEGGLVEKGKKKKLPESKGVTVIPQLLLFSAIVLKIRLDGCQTGETSGHGFNWLNRIG